MKLPVVTGQDPLQRGEDEGPGQREGLRAAAGGEEGRQPRPRRAFHSRRVRARQRLEDGLEGWARKQGGIHANWKHFTTYIKSRDNVV
jgi:hypothetical protein